MNKSQQEEGDSYSTHQSRLHNGVNSFQLAKGLSSSQRLGRCDQATFTDQIICNCACQAIPKLKEKAHKSFMQVIQIENLYKEQIQELKSFYEESLRAKDRKFEIKEQSLNQRCKQLESEIEKLKQQYENAKPNDTPEISFHLQEIDNIALVSLPDESSESIYSENIRQFISTPNLRESAKQLQDEMNIFIANIKVIEKQSSPIQQSSASSAPHRLEEAAIRQIENQAQRIFEFVHSIIEITVQSHEQYNQLVQLFNQAENRYTKLYGLHQSGQKQVKYLTDHVKKMTQERTKVERKNNQLEKAIKNQEDSIKFLKKMISEKQLSTVNQPKKDIDCLSYLNLKDDDNESIVVNSLLTTKFERKNHNLVSSLQANDRILPRGLNFKKKVVTEKN